MEPLGVHHVSINVNDVATAVAFYTEMLGFTIRDDRPNFGFEGAWLDCGSQQLHLIAGDVPAARGQHFAVRVANLEVSIEELRAAGVAVSVASPVGTGRQAFVADPSGNLIELHQTA